jgi:hypothetical protein
VERPGLLRSSKTASGENEKSLRNRSKRIMPKAPPLQKRKDGQPKSTETQSWTRGPPPPNLPFGGRFADARFHSLRAGQVIASLRQLRPRASTSALLRARLQTESAYSARDKPLDEVKNQENKKYIVGKSEMDLKVPNHEPASRSGAVLNGKVGELKSREKHKPEKVEGGYRGLLKISETLANTHEVFLERKRCLENAQPSRPKRANRNLVCRMQEKTAFPITTGTARPTR